MSNKEYPECEKIAEVSEELNKIGRFLNWLKMEKGFVLGEYYKVDEIDDISDYGDLEEVIFPVHTSTDKLLAEYYDIDMNKVEEERREMLEDIRSKNG